LRIFEKHEKVIIQNSNLLFAIRFIKTGAVIGRWLSESLGGFFVQFCTWEVATCRCVTERLWSRRDSSLDIAKRHVLKMRAFLV